MNFRILLSSRINVIQGRGTGKLVRTTDRFKT